MPIIQSLSLSADLSAPRQFRKIIAPLLSRIGLENDAAETVLLAASEIIVNIVQHGHPTAQSIRADLACRANTWSLRIIDDGGPFSDIFERIKDAASQDQDELRESGMGLQILSSAFPDWSYAPRNSEADVNVLKITGPIGYEAEQRPSVLVIEDEELQAEIVSAYLAADFDVTLAKSVAEAETAIKAQAPDIIISDVKLPDGDGLELRQRLRHHATMRATPFIFLTGIQDMSVADKADELGIDNYLTKPTDKLQLVSAVRRAHRRVRDIADAVGDRIDQELTQSLTPGLPETFGDVSLRWRTVSSSAGGGDLIYHREVSGGNLLILADLMGHGERAKFHAHVLGGYLAGLVGSLSHRGAPNEVLTGISNAFVTEQSLKKTIATAIVIHIADNGRLSISCAGHPPPYLVKAEGVNALPVAGILPGLTLDQEYEVYDHQLAEGERVVVVTDGLLEIGPVEDHEKVAEALMMDAFETKDSPAEMLIEKSFNKAFEASLTGLKDDSTMIVLSRDRHD